MKKVVRLTENDLVKIIKKVLSEQDTNQPIPQKNGLGKSQNATEEVVDGVKTFKVSGGDKKNLEGIANQKGELIFGKGKFETINEVSGNYPTILVIKKEAYQKLISDQGITVQQTEHCAEPRWNGKNWVYKQKSGKSTGAFPERPLGFDNFNRILNGKGSIFGCSEQDRHVSDKHKGDYSGGNFTTPWVSKASRDFFNNPAESQNFYNFCSILKATSFYRINGFPGVTGKCPVFIKGSDRIMTQNLPKNDYIVIQGV
jgi:hypothetical protein